MKLDIILIIGLIVNTLFAVIYPTQIFGDDPLGLSENTNSDLSNYITVNGDGLIQGYDSTTGELTSNSEGFNDLSNAVTSTEEDAGVLAFSETFGFVDWVKTGFKLIKTALMFVVGFIFLLWQLVFPLNFLVGIPFSLLYIYSMASFIIGR